MLEFLQPFVCPDYGLTQRALAASKAQTGLLQQQIQTLQAHLAMQQETGAALSAAKQKLVILEGLLAQYDTPAVYDTPPFLDATRLPYLPAIAVTDSNESVQVPDATAIYSPTDRDRMETGPIRSLSKAARLKKVWGDIINPDNLKYVPDVRDNWQTPYETRFRKKGDCEDGVVWFIAKCRAAGLRADEVFNAVGPTSFGYHSFPIVYLSAMDAVEFGISDPDAEGWYIFESTLDVVPARPLRLVGSPYWVDNGLANWRFAGQIYPVALGLFNGKQPSSIPSADIIENSFEKIEAIRRYHAGLV